MTDPNQTIALAHQVLLADHTPPWATEEFGYDSDKWGDEQDRSEWYQALSEQLEGQALQLAGFVISAFPPEGGIKYRARVQDHRGARWAVHGQLGFLARHCAEQHLSIVWIRPLRKEES